MRALHPRVSGGAAPSEGRRCTCSASCARGPTNTTRRSTSSSASTSRARSSSTALETGHRALRGRSGAWPSPAFAETVQRFATAQNGAHGARGEGDHSRGPQSISPTRTGRKSATRSARTATRASRWTRTRSTGNCSHGSSISPPKAWSASPPAPRAEPCARCQPTNDSNYRVRLGRRGHSCNSTTDWGQKTMQHSSTAASPAGAHRRRAAALAIAALFAASGAAQAFEIDTGNPDLADALGQHGPLQPRRARASRRTPTIIGSPNYDDGDRNFSNGSLVTNRLDVLSEFDFVYKRKMRLSRERGGLVRQRVQQPRQHEQRDRQHAGERPAGRRRAEPLHQALCEGRVGRIPRRVRVRQFRRRATCRSASRPDSTPCTGATACCWAARSTASRTRRTRSTSGRASRRRGREAKELFRPRGGITLQAQPIEGPVGGRPVVLQLAGGPDTRIGQLPDDPGSAQLRRRLVHLRTQSARRSDSGRTGLPAPVARVRHQAADQLRQPRRLGHFGALEPGMARRHAGLLLSQCDRRLSAGDGDAGRDSALPAAACTPRGGIVAARRHALLRQPQRDHDRRPAEIRQARHSTTAPTATTSTSSASRWRRASTG